MSDNERGEYCEPCETWYHTKEEMQPMELNGKVFMMCMLCYANYHFKQQMLFPKPTNQPDRNEVM